MSKRIVNVIEVADNSVLSVTSFIVESDHPRDSAVVRAEECFKDKAVENGAPSDEDDFIDETDYSTYENGTYCIQIVWSD